MTIAESSWRPIDLAVVMDALKDDLAPAILHRSDGHPLLHPGKVHILAAEPESGKSWFALAACAEQIKEDQSVVFIDFEDDERSIVERLRDLGVGRDDILGRFFYLRPDEPLRQGQVLADLVLRSGPTLVVIDGVTEAMALHGLDPISNADIATFFELLPRACARQGPAVLALDHVVKSKDARGRYAFGGQHKLAGIAVGYVLEVVAPFGRGRAGKAKLTVTKDRPRFVRAVAGADGRQGGELQLVPDGERVTVRIEAPTAEFRPLHLMELASKTLEATPDGLDKTALRNGLPGKTKNKDHAIRCLVADGYVTIEVAARGKHVHRSVRPYRSDDERVVTSEKRVKVDLPPGEVDRP